DPCSRPDDTVGVREPRRPGRARSGSEPGASWWQCYRDLAAGARRIRRQAAAAVEAVRAAGIANRGAGQSDDASAPARVSQNTRGRPTGGSGVGNRRGEQGGSIRGSLRDSSQRARRGDPHFGGPLEAAHSTEIVGLAARYRLPAMYLDRRYVLQGGLLSYGQN